MKLVQQETKSGCVIACLAMVSGRTFEEVEKLSGKDTSKTGIGMEDKLKTLGLLGHGFIHHFPPVLMPERIYIVTVPSLNMQGCNHSIVIDTYEDDYVMDPNTGREDKLIYGIKDDLKKGIVGLKGYGDVIEIIGGYSYHDELVKEQELKGVA